MTGIREGLRQIVISMCLAEISAWFEVWVPHSNYYVKEGQTVTLQCTFPKTQVWDLGDQNVYLLRDEKKQWKEQDKSFRGRVSGNGHSLFGGLAYEIITNIHTQDFGKYQCLIQVKGQGIDYKTITLSVIRIHVYTFNTTQHNICLEYYHLA
uniref:Ig-like domain-containing protein n=1 Tax=Amazona collaria TaxID=241587 RepID=A0A8B9J120_9PSIT